MTKALESNTPRYVMAGAILVQAIAWMNIAFGAAAGTCAALQTCAVNEDAVLYVARALQVTLYAAAGSFLLFPSRKPAARALGFVLLMIATSFAQGVVLRTQIWPEPSGALALLLSARADSFLPFATCALAMRFPEVHSQAPTLNRLATFATAATLLLGFVLLVANLSTKRLMIDGVASAYQVVAPGYWTILFGSTLAALVLIMLKARYTTTAERARLRLVTTHLFVVAVAIGAYVVLNELSSEARDTLDHNGLNDLLTPVLQLLVLSLPLVATYALLVERAVDETVRVRNAVGYRLASATLGLGAAVPFVLVAWYLWNLRAQTINDAFTGANLVALICVVLFGVLLFRMRTSAQRAVDRAFVRTTYDSSAVLAELHDRIARVPNVEEFAVHLSDVVTDLGFAKTTLLVPSGHNGTVPGGPLERTPAARFTTMVEVADQSQVEFPWRVAILRDDGSAMAMLELAAKRGEAPVTPQDRELLLTLTRQIARPLAQLLERTEADEPPARECADCGAVLDAAASTCGECSGTELVTSLLPKRLQRRFTIVRRLGTGSMGVVYEADDDTLRRRVALKTLPRIGDDRVAQLREEAQAMARVSHPNVATVYQLEVWRGVPVVVMELFERGTFAKPLEGGVSLATLKHLGSGLADGLAYLHALGLVHADLKPSNLGIAASGTAKIMDFGLSRLADSGGSLHAPDQATPAAPDQSFFAGTPAYLAPELVRGETPSPVSDVWALAVSLFEIYTGVNPFRRLTVAETMRAIIRDPVPDPGALRSDATEAIRRFFACCLARPPAERLASAEDFRARLIAV